MHNGKKFCFTLLLLVLCLVLIGCGKGPGRVVHYLDYDSYRELPGVTAEEIDVIERIKSQRDSFVYAMNYSTEAFLDEDGNIGGYAALLCDWLSVFFGIPFKPAILEWDQLITSLASFSADFTGELTATNERQKIYFMTDAIAGRSIKVMRITKDETFPVPERTRPPRYAFLNGATAFDMVAPYLPANYETILVIDYDAAYQLLKAGIVEAFFEDGPAQAAFDKYGDVTAEDFFPLIYSPVSMSTQNPELAPFISVMQKALNAGFTYHLTELYNEGHHDFLRQKLSTQLTEEEKEYISLHSTPDTAIKIAAEHENYPSSFYNTHDKEWQGLAFDILNTVKKYTGLHFEIANTTNADLPDLLQMLEDGHVSMIMELFRVESREDRFLWSDAPYKQDYYAMISLADHKDLNINEVFYSRVGVLKDTAYTAMFNQWFPHHANTVEYVRNIDAINGLARGEIDLLMTTHHQLLSIVNFLERPGYKVNILFNHPSNSYFGFNLTERILCSIISKAQRMVDTKDVFSHWDHKVFDYRHKMVQAQRPWLIGTSMLLLGMLSMVVIMLNRKRREGRRLEQLVRRRTRELEAASRAAMAASHTKSEFLANMSHEIRTPINAVTGMTTIARNSKDLNRIYDCLDKIGAASRQLLSLINDILDMSKIEARKFDLSNEPFSLETMLNNVSSIIDVRTTEKKQHFTVDIAPDLPKTVIGDEMRLSQILLNLLSNAVKFTPEGGEIWLTLKRIGERDGKEEIEASVRDSGIGITEQQKSRLFNAFVQADSGTAKRFGGTGLGLAISKSLTEMMGGGISVKSIPGKGSCFTMRVLLEPGSQEVLQAARAGKVPSDFHFNGHTLLLTEDVPINREIVVALLEDTNVTIECAENGQIAVDMFCTNPDRYDMIFMDLQMPIMDGYDAACAIRAFEADMRKKGTFLPKWPDGIPIIAMTANAFAEDVEHCLKVGMNGHIAKPIEVETLLNVANKYLGKAAILVSD